MGILYGLVFWPSLDSEAQKSHVFDNQYVLAKLNPLLDQVFSERGNSAAGASARSHIELLKLTFSDYRAFNGRQLQEENMREAFKSFARRDLVGYYDSRGTGRPADFKRRREDCPSAPGGDQEPPRATGESLSSRMFGRNVRRRINSDVHEEANVEESDVTRGVEAGKQPEDA
jgi:hypothetical protein